MATTDIEKLRVTKANQLIEATLIESSVKLALNDQKIVLSIISQLSPDDDKLKEYSLTVSELSSMTKVDSNRLYEDLDRICKRLTSSSVRIVEPDNPKGFLYTTWFSVASYNPSEGCVDFVISPALKPYLIQLQSSFTSYYLNQVIRMNSVYSIRMYELLKHYLNASKRTAAIREITVQELREKIGVPEGKYSLFSNFRKFVIEKSQAELEEKSDLSFDFELIRRGRSVHSIKFTMFHAKATLDIDKGATIQDVMSEEHISDLIGVQLDNNVMDSLNFDPALMGVLGALFGEEITDVDIYMMVTNYSNELIKEASSDLMTAIREGKIEGSHRNYFNGILKNKKKELAEAAQTITRTKKGTEEKLLDEGWNMDKEDDEARAKEAG